MQSCRSTCMVHAPSAVFYVTPGTDKEEAAHIASQILQLHKEDNIAYRDMVRSSPEVAGAESSSCRHHLRMLLSLSSIRGTQVQRMSVGVQQSCARAACGRACWRWPSLVLMGRGSF